MSTTSTNSGTFWLPPNISPLTGGQDTLFYFIYGLGIFFFVLIVGLMSYFAWKYRKRKEGEKTQDIRGNVKLEILWITIPTILFLVIFAWGFYIWVGLNVPPQNSREVRVTARKWDWLFTDVKTGAQTADLIVAVNQPIRLVMSSVDVIHGFYVPAFRINKDVLPNQYTVIWFQAEKEGKYPILCTQYCGTRHSQMVRYVNVMSAEQVEKTLAGAMGAGLTPAQLGEKIFSGKGGCASCHDVSPAKTRIVGPPLYGSYGKQTAITENGAQKTVPFDDNYIRESILNPNFRGVPGYPSVMPSYQGQLSDKELDALVDYLKTLK